MKKYSIILSILLPFLLQKAYSQANANQWTWLKGPKDRNQIGYFGSPGNLANNPGANYGLVGTSINNKFYIFGGFGLDGSGDVGYLADLWEYNQLTNLWTWLKGPGTRNVPASYGTKGIESSTNLPGSRADPIIWNSNGNIYLFGGYNLYGEKFNDLWKYNISTNNWTWLKGSSAANQFGNYGIKGAANINNIPGGRQSSCAWEYNGNLYLFGGYGYAETGINSYLNDLWVYNINTNIWTWIGGTKQIESNGVYGTIGVGSTSNIPGSRTGATFWQINEKFYFFGGYGKSQSTFGKQNDLFEYNILNNEWKFLKGNSTSDNYGVYGSKNQSSITNKPGARSFSYSWTYNGKLFLFGGYGIGRTTSDGLLNDLWVYDTKTNNWLWETGEALPNYSGIYGAIGVSNILNTPGARNGGVATYYDKKLYLFAGYGYDGSGLGGSLNDLWSFTPQCNNSDFYSIKNGNWNDASVWSCGRVPSVSDQITIKGHSITVNGNFNVWQVNFEGGNLIMPNGSSLNLALYD